MPYYGAKHAGITIVRIVHAWLIMVEIRHARHAEQNISHAIPRDPTGASAS
jgi:hypothetical protein